MYEASKRLADLAGALTGLLICAIPMALVAAFVRIRTGPPVLYRDVRAGRNGRPFVMRKFRTMRVETVDGNGRPLTDDERLTALGRWLRATSLDELPELLNVLTGEMSLVGPRPLPVRYLPRYTPEQARRLLVRPGITGWAQINGRNAISWPEKLALDVWYVDNRSAAVDTRILMLTLSQVAQRRGISAPGHATMPEFDGTETPERGAPREPELP